MLGLSSLEIDWAEIEAASGMSLSDEARAGIRWELERYWLRARQPHVTESQLRRKQERFLKHVEAIEGLLADLAQSASDGSGDAAPEGWMLEVFGEALQNSLIEQGTPIGEAQQRRLQWHDDLESLRIVLPRVREVLEIPLPRCQPAESPSETEARMWFVRRVADILEVEGHSIAANHDPETPIVAMVRMMGLGGHETTASLARDIQKALKGRQAK